MKQKRGQFFILAAVILVSLLAGIFLYKNQVFLQESRGGVESLKQEVDGETGAVIDYGLYKNVDKLEDFIIDMSENLLGRSGPDMIFFYGNQSELKILNLGSETINYNLSSNEGSCAGIKNNITTSINWGVTGLEIILDLADLESKGLICNVSISSTDDKLTFNVNATDSSPIEYEIPLNQGKNFYFVIKREVGQEIYVATK